MLNPFLILQTPADAPTLNRVDLLAAVALETQGHEIQGQGHADVGIPGQGNGVCQMDTVRY